MANVVLAPAKKAAIAVAVSILTTVYHMLRDGTCYQDLGAEHFTRRNPAKAAARVANRIRNLGYHAEIRGCRMKPRIQFLRRRRELCAATDELCRGAPGVMRKRVETSHRVDANDRLARGQRSIRDRAQRRTAMGALQFVQCIRTVLQSNEGLRGRCHGSIECAVGRCRRLAPRLDLAGVVASGRRRGDFTSDRGCTSHRLRAQLRGADIVWPAVQRAVFGLITRCLGEPRRVLERVQRARESPLLVLRFGRAVHIRHECLRPAQRIGRLRH